MIEEWEMTPDEGGAYSDLIDLVARLRHLAGTPDQVIGVGEAWGALEALREGDAVEVNVGLSIGFRRGDSEFSEGLYLGLRVNWEGIELDELNTAYSKQFGSDHHTEDYATLRPRQSFDTSEVRRWIQKVELLLKDEDTRLGVQRDHD